MRARTLSLYAAAGTAVLLVAIAAWAWHAGQVSPRDLLALMRDHETDPAAPLLVVLVFVAAGFVLVPVTGLIALTGLAFGPVHGALYALLGATASGACGYWAGRHLAHGALARYGGARVAAVRRHLEARGLIAVILVRVVPSGPFTLMNLAAGGAGIRFRDFLLGTVLGMTPGVLATVGLIHGVRALIDAPDARTAAIVAFAAAAVFALAYALRRALARRRGRRPS